MDAVAGFVIRRRWWVIAGWFALAVAGGFAAPHATAKLSYEFGLPGQPGYEANKRIAAQFGNTGGQNAPVLLVATDHGAPVPELVARELQHHVAAAVPGSRTVTWADDQRLRSADGATAVALVYPVAQPGADPYLRALPALERVAAGAQVPVTVSGQDALADSGGKGGVDVLAETLFGGVGALLVLVLVFGSFLAVTPLIVATSSILTTFLALWGLAELTNVSFIVQYLLALIGLGVSIDYALLIVTRWRELLGGGATAEEAVAGTLRTAGRSVLFSGITVAVSLASLVALPVPFLRSVGFTGLLIPVLSVASALTLLPAVLLVAGRRLAWPHRRSTSPDSRLWQRIGHLVVHRRWTAITLGTLILLAAAAPVLGIRLGAPTNAALASTGGPAAHAVTTLDSSGIGAGLTQPIEVLTDNPPTMAAALTKVDGIAAVTAPPQWRHGTVAVVDAWTSADASSRAGADAAARARTTAEAHGGQVGGLPGQNDDFIHAVYDNAWWIGLIIVAATFVLLSFALRSILLPVKALLLNVLSVAAAYGLTVLIWQHGVATEALFNQSPTGAVTVWVPVAVFAFLFGLSMDYEVFLLARIRQERDAGHDTDQATIAGVSRTGRLVTSGALILFLAFVSLSRIPAVDVKVLATGLALGIILDATLVRGILAPALVAALGSANWWIPRRRSKEPQPARQSP